MTHKQRAEDKRKHPRFYCADSECLQQIQADRTWCAIHQPEPDDIPFDNKLKQEVFIDSLWGRSERG